MRKIYRSLLIMASLLAVLTIATGSRFLEPHCDTEWDFVPRSLLSGAPAPKSPQLSISMDSHEIYIRPEKNSFKVDAVCRFYNAGKTTTEWVGFPMQGNRCKNHRLLKPAFSRFDAWINGRMVDLVLEPRFAQHMKRFVNEMIQRPSREEREKSFDRWLVTYVTFPGRAHTTIRFSYEDLYHFPKEINMSTKRASGMYLIGTSALWAGAIKRCSLTIDASRIGGTTNLASTSGFGLSRISKNVVIYEATNYEPKPRSSAEFIAYVIK